MPFFFQLLHESVLPMKHAANGIRKPLFKIGCCILCTQIVKGIMTAAFHIKEKYEGKQQGEPEISQDSESRLSPFRSFKLRTFPTFLHDSF